MALTTVGLFGVDVAQPEELFVDLHPRWHPRGALLLVDSAHNTSKGARQYVADVSDVVTPRA